MLEKLEEFFVQKSVPSAYDDSLTWYELIAKFQTKINEAIDYINTSFKDKLNEVIRDRNNVIKVKINTLINDRNSTVVYTLDETTKATKELVKAMEALVDERNGATKTAVNAIIYDEHRRTSGLVSAINTNTVRINSNNLNIKNAINEQTGKAFSVIDYADEDSGIISIVTSSFNTIETEDAQIMTPVSQTAEDLKDITKPEIETPDVIGGSISGIDNTIEEIS